jgi:hypothetical protein
MSEILIEPIKSMMELVTTAASDLCNSGKASLQSVGEETSFDLKITLFQDENTMAIYLKNNNEVYYKKVVSLSDFDSELDAQTMLYGTLLTELLSTYAVILHTMKHYKIPLNTESVPEPLPNEG